ncbi:MAG: glycosyltransferase family 2 protein [Formivibrio sp.]|nr:glycosyltransferase family 2 protein [Formivibrio sp.]
MRELISWLLVIGADAIAVPTIVFCLEIVAGILPRHIRQSYDRDFRGRAAVLVPAHNESSGIVPTLEDIRTQLHAGDLLLVVADNCIDDTAEQARTRGAVVLERHDATRIGKGYALDFGIKHLEKDPPDFVVMVDADCRLDSGVIDKLISASLTTGRPTQALYLMKAPDARVNNQIAEFAWRVKNWVRPLGLARLGLPCQLTGSGMAFPWSVIRTVNLASGWIVEDLKLGLELALAGHPPLFCPDACVTSQFAVSERGADTQRRRWHQGHLVSIIALVPRLLWIATVRRNLNLMALALDVAVPPLSLLATLLFLILTIASFAAILGIGSAAFFISASCIVGFASAVVCAWRIYGTEILPSRAILSLPGYILEKIGIYHQVLSGKMIFNWIRTDREKS